MQRRLEEGDAYFTLLHRSWGEGIRRIFAELPEPPW